MNKKKVFKIGGIICGAVVVGLGIGFVSYKLMAEKTNDVESNDTNTKTLNSPYRITSNSLDSFDLYFLQLENDNKNTVYSPLSIKYALEMLSEGADGETKSQLDSIIGDYTAKKYDNNSNMSLANALFIRDSFKNNINENYINNLKNKFNAEVIFDPFNNAENINTWVSHNTFNLINNLLDDVSEGQFYLINSLAIDMEWINLIQAAVNNKTNQLDYYVRYEHENEVGNTEYGAYHKAIYPIINEAYSTLKFNDGKTNAKSVEIGASINNYDIISEIGEEQIRKIVTSSYYNEWLKENPDEPVDNLDEYLNNYIEEISSNYKKIAYSTDFSLYVDDDVKVFAKDLQEYNGTTLQYIGIMPKNVSLNEYIKNVTPNTINDYIKNLKNIANREDFEDGKVTKVTGKIPLFETTYELNLNEDLQKMGISDIFDENKIDISKITSSKELHIDTTHKAKIEFSNEGIKAAAATSDGGAGDVNGGFDYFFKLPMVEIDLTFDKPYMYLIRDKKSGEVWFVGSVYEPIENNNIDY